MWVDLFLLCFRLRFSTSQLLASPVYFWHDVPNHPHGGSIKNNIWNNDPNHLHGGSHSLNGLLCSHCFINGLTHRERFHKRIAAGLPTEHLQPFCHHPVSYFHAQRNHFWKHLIHHIVHALPQRHWRGGSAGLPRHDVCKCLWLLQRQRHLQHECQPLLHADVLAQPLCQQLLHLKRQLYLLSLGLHHPNALCVL